MSRFIRSEAYKGKLLEIRDGIAADIREFTVRNIT